MASTSTILVTGAAGQLGKRILSRAARRPSLKVVGLAQDDLDVCDPEAVQQALADHRPDVVLHAAAYTAVDRAESEADKAFEVNATAVGHVATACRDAGVSMIHISTDYVFGDVPRRPLVPGDATRAIERLRKDQTRGEKKLLRLKSGVSGALVRVAWLYDAEGSNFLNTMLRLAASHGKLKVVNDQHGVPTAVPVLADALLDMAERGADMPQGVWHFAHAGHTTWQGFASEIVRVAGMGRSGGTRGDGGLSHASRSARLERVGWRTPSRGHGVAAVHMGGRLGGSLGPETGGWLTRMSELWLRHDR